MAKFNYFAEAEQAAQAAFQSRRDRALAPLVRLLTRLGITPNGLSLLGMLALAPFGYLVLTATDPATVAWSCLFILLHILIDGVDGPLARAQGVAGNGGAFIDMCCDHGGLAVVTFLCSGAGIVNATLAGVYVFLYTLAVVFVIWLNVLEMPFRFVARSKYVLYALLFVVASTAAMRGAEPDWRWLDGFLLAASVVHGGTCVLGFARVKRWLDHNDL